MLDIIEYTASKPRHVRGTDVKAGTKLFAIRSIRNGQTHYFVWSYVHRATAEKVLPRLGLGPIRQSDLEANWRTDLERLTPTELQLDEAK